MLKCYQPNLFEWLIRMESGVCDEMLSGRNVLQYLIYENV